MILKYVNISESIVVVVFFIYLNGNVLSKTRITRITESSKCPLINPFKPNRISQPYKLDLSISVVGAVNILSPPVSIFTDRSKAVLLLWILFYYVCFMFIMLSCLFLSASWSPAGKGLTSWLSCL